MGTSRFSVSGLALALAALLAGLAGGCEQAPSAESIREWTPGDHHSAEDDRAQAGQASPAPRAQPGRAEAPAGGKTDEVAGLADLAWRQQCTTCHGPLGRGDGPMGGMLHAPDLTARDWQGRVTDAQIAATIKSGKDKMPKFDLPDPVVQGLVARIRQLRGP